MPALVGEALRGVVAGATACDHVATRFIAEALPHPPLVTSLLGTLSRSADYGCLWFGLAAIPWLLRRPRGAARFFYVSAGVLGAEMLTYAVKRRVRRPRPPQREGAADGLVPLPPSHSFPSSHASMAVLAVATMSRLYPRLRGPVVVLAATLTASRVYLRVHYLGDVVAGLLLGRVLAAVFARTVRAPR